MKEVHADPNSIFNQPEFKMKRIELAKKSHANPNSGFNRPEFIEKQRILQANKWSDPNSKLNSPEFRIKESIATTKRWMDPDDSFNSLECKMKRGLRIRERFVEPFQCFREGSPYNGKVYQLQTEAANELGIDRRGIGAALRGRLGTSGGYVFKYLDLELEQIRTRTQVDIQNKRGRPFICSNGKIYRTQIAAAKELGIDTPLVWAVLHRKRKTTQGYTFKYIDQIET